MIKITSREIEEMIRNKMKEKGLPETEINEELINTIKNKIINTTNTKKTDDVEKDVTVDVSANTPTETPGEIPDIISTTTIKDPKSQELAKKEGSLEEKEHELENKENELKQKEHEIGIRKAELKQKEEELSYVPELPKIFDKIGPEKMFVFNMNEISVGGEKLSQTPLRLVVNPDEKKSMNNIWLEKGKRSAEVYMAKFEKIGKIVFDPFEGTSKFEEKKFEIEQPQEDTQNQVEETPMPMIDAIEPIKDVTKPLNNDMGLKAVDVQQMLKDKIEEILKGYFINK